MQSRKKNHIPDVLKHIRNYSAEASVFFFRVMVCYGVIAICFIIMLLNLYFLQVVNFENYETRSNENRIKIIPLPPTRGLIYDRHNVPIAINLPFYQLEITPEKVPNLNQTFEQLRTIVNLTDEDIVQFHKAKKRVFLSPVVLKSTLSETEVARFSINKFRFPGVDVKIHKKRYYPYSSLLAHPVGYVAKMNEADEKRLSALGIFQQYAATRDINKIGKMGIERYYESALRGKMGYKKVEVNNRSIIVREIQRHLPQVGSDLHLTIDIQLQSYIEKLLGNSRGTAIVVNPQTAEILSLVSTPSFDPNLFVNGISQNAYKKLINNTRNSPLLNRAIQGIYSPASTIKPHIALAALTEGIISPNTIIPSMGSWELPGTKKRFRDWKSAGHGKVDVIKAIQESVDSFYYQIAHDMGIDKLSRWMKQFGYNEHSGIDLIEETIGILPTREWKQKTIKQPWYKGDTIPIGIGQGYWTATPIQMMNSLMILINNGEKKIPHLLKKTLQNEAQIPNKSHKKQMAVTAPDAYWRLIKEGMYRVAHQQNGTAYKEFKDAPYRIAAKTGTSQLYSYQTYNVKKIREHLRDNRLMIAYGPFENPTVAVIIVLENWSPPERSITEITRKIFDFILQPNTEERGLIVPLHSLLKPTIVE